MENKLKELEVAVKTLDEHKAEDIKELYVADHTPFATYYVLATCMNPRQLNAMSEHLEDEFEKAGINVSVKEGEPDSGWMIIQGGEVIVHLFLDVTRKEIALDALIEKLESKTRKSSEKSEEEAE